MNAAGTGGMRFGRDAAGSCSAWKAAIPRNNGADMDHLNRGADAQDKGWLGRVGLELAVLVNLGIAFGLWAAFGPLVALLFAGLEGALFGLITSRR
jgi:hypothetical protein